ncbi:hypothetical protein ACHWQZ_G005121 [Mnemiopsis leidyi]
MTFTFDTGERSDRNINYFLGSFMVLCVITSTLLNPLIGFSYTKKRKTIQNFLFKVIAASDFITTLIPGIFISYVFFSSIKFEYTFKTEIPEFLSCTFGCISQVTTTMMAVTRMISILKPFLRVKFKVVLAYLIFYAVYMALGNAGSLIVAYMKEARNYTAAGTNTKDSYEDQIETLKSLNKFVCFVMNMIHCIMGVLCSFVSVGYLRFIIGTGSAEQARKLKSCYTILIMNIPYIFSIVSNFLAFFKVLKIDFKLVNHYLIPILTSAFNPCVIMIRTNVIQELKESAAGKDKRILTRTNTRNLPRTALLTRTVIISNMVTEPEIELGELEPEVVQFGELEQRSDLGEDYEST